MILSASRRTDIPSYYSEWFYNRIKEGFVYARNPMNAHQVSKIDLSPDIVDCIVFWTKNPQPMMARLAELSAYHYYFQFTLTGYGRDIESNVPHKREVMIPMFRELAGMMGSRRVIWRYDPIFFSDIYTPEYHIHAFEQIAAQLKGYTDRCVISFVDDYAKTKKNMQSISTYRLLQSELFLFAAALRRIAEENGMTIGSCAEEIDLAKCGIEHNCCIDKGRIEEIIGCKINAGKDKNQRPACGCIESVEIGAYNTCRNGCKYCYANYSTENVMRNCASYDAQSPLLCSSLGENDKITIRKAASLKERQQSIFDL